MSDVIKVIGTIISLATITVILSRQSDTVGVVGAAGKAFSDTLKTAMGR